MKKDKSLVGNLSWQTAYQVIAICMPFITTPYISRVLGASQLGLFSDTSSLALFFRMFGMLGNVHYGTREISRLRESDHERSVAFKEIFTIQVIGTLLAVVMYLIYSTVFRYHGLITWIQTIWIAECFLNIGWLYDGVEDFKYSSILGTGIKLFQLISILLFVKSSQHIERYAFIMSISLVLYNLVLFLGINRIVDLKVRIDRSELPARLKATFLLFIPDAATTIFRLMSKLVLGGVGDEVQSGYYYNADHLVNIPLLVITGLCTVMLSRMSMVSGDNEKHSKLFYSVSEIILIIAIAFSFGIGSIAKEFIPFFFGDEFLPCIRLTYVFCIIMVIKAFSNVMNSMYLIPKEKDKLFVRAVITGAVVNLIANGIFTSYLKMGAMGATVSTLIAETSVVIVEIIMTRKELNIGKIFFDLIPYFASGVIMVFAVRTTAQLLAVSKAGLFIRIAAEIAVGAFCFVALTAVYLIVTKRYKVFIEAIRNE